jgi:exopolyphosphatase / guanosine-5'-triphosphate,3'-diphosphate pyrophosphatase
VREGLLQGIAHETFSRKEPHRYNGAARQLLTGTRSFARRLEYDQQHAEHVRELSLQLFDQLQPVHRLPPQSRVLLEAGALLHDTGHMISHRGHQKHGEYLALNGDIPGLEGRERAIVAGLVRYHNRKSEPAGHHLAYSSLDDADKPILRRLAAILRIAEALDHSHRQRVLKVRASFQRGAVGLEVQASGDAAEDLRDAVRSAEWFEKECHVKLYFRRAPGIMNRIRRLLRPSSLLRNS